MHSRRTAQDVRRSFIEFFAERGHRHVSSSPLVPHGDATLLFTNAGMVQFKDYFLGLDKPESKRAVTAQKCLRVSGKHNDLENVGPSPRHHTFFEMLGNFSFGDYFKAEAIEFGWDLVTRVWGLDPKILSATVFEQDDEAEALWRKISTLPAERIHRCGAKDNFWAMGDTGPCGPCSEIFVDRAPHLPEVSWEEGTDSGRYLEIWNLVFMQFERSADGKMTPLPNPSIDTGAGLERVTAVLQGVDSNYDTDLFRPILEATATLAKTAYGRDAARDVSMRVIADHLRAVSFLLADGVIPGNEGRGYVLRRVLRRAVRHGMRLGFEEPFLHRLVPVLGEVMDQTYPELVATRGATTATIQAEEEKFLSTVATASKLVQETIEDAKRSGARTLSGESIFKAYDTFGLPIDVIREIAEEEKFGLDEEGFEKALTEQKKRSRAVGKQAQEQARLLQSALLKKKDSSEGDLAQTVFAGYDALEFAGARVLALAVSENEGRGSGRAESVAAGGRAVALLDKTVFYAESGGQVGDQGEITWPSGRARVTDTVKEAGFFFHHLEVLSGALEVGQAVDLAVAPDLRRATQRNHTATHLLHAALRAVLGTSVRQAGSLVAPDRLRFDFTHGHPVSEDERRRVEDLVNEWVLRAVDTSIVETGYQEAVAAGAMALFGEKYGDRVRTVSIPGFSLELCGGCHVRNTGEIGPFVLLSEKGVASGVRRIEALTGHGAFAWIREREAALAAAEREVGAPAERLAQEIVVLKEKQRGAEKQLSALRLKVAAGGAGGGSAEAADVTEIGGLKVLVREVPDAPANDLRTLADALRSKLGSGVVVLAARAEGKVSLLAAVTPDAVGRIKAGELVKRIAPAVGGSGGGRPDFAQAGGKEPEKLDAALAAVPGQVRELLGQA
jgi:alanyl-tRNA synthetase